LGIEVILIMEKTILIVEDDSQIQKNSSDALEKYGYRVIPVDSPMEAIQSLSKEKFDLLISGYGNLEQKFELIKKANEIAPDLKSLIIVQEDFEEIIHSWIDINENIQVIQESIPFNEIDFTATVQKIFNKNIFGLDKYFNETTPIKEITIKSSAKKDDYINEVQNFASLRGARTRMVDNIADILDELVMNAIYDAPVDDAGKSKYLNTERVEKINLEENEYACLKYCYENGKLGLSVSDPFGTLTSTQILNYLKKCFAKGSDQIDDKKGGAGLGLYKIYDAVNYFIININKNIKTEIITILDLQISMSVFRAQKKSFHIFTVE